MQNKPSEGKTKKTVSEIVRHKNFDTMLID